jgi:lipopolysaccharide transport system permease protein
MTVVFSVIFGAVVKIPTEGLPTFLFYFAGLLGWNYFAQTFQSTASTLISNAGLFGKVYFPRLVVPLSAALSNLLAFGLQLTTFICAWTYFKFFTDAGSNFGFSAAIVWLPLLVLQLVVLSLGAGLGLCALTAKYRDFTFLTPFVIQMWMYATPVIYPLSQIPERWRWIAVLNPMTMPTEAIKLMFLGQGVVTPTFITVSLGVTLVLLIVGLMVFNKVEKTFVDTV